MQVCVPAGMFGSAIAFCMTAGCLKDKDCTAHPGGICAPVKQSCCNAMAGLYCVYPDKGCRDDGDCPGGHCEANMIAGFAECKDGPAMCPASL